MKTREHEPAEDLQLEEELQILEERTRPPTTLSADFFLRPIADLCHTQELITLAPAARVAKAIQLMQEHRIGAVLIVEQEKLVGIVTERDVMMKVLDSKLDPEQAEVREIMTAGPECLRKEDQLAYLLNAMHVGGFRHVPIVDGDGRPTHLISVRDALAFIVDNFPAELLNIPSQPFRGPPSQYG
jgi:CBS-domain-containing membrane protein